MTTAVKTEGREVVEQAYKEYLQGIAIYQGDNKRLKNCKDGFKKAVLSNPKITKEDIVEFINDYAFRWSSDRKIAYEDYYQD